MRLILLLVAILALTVSSFEEIRCKTTAKHFQSAAKVLSKRVKPELILESLCRKTNKGCGDHTGLVRAIKSVATSRIFCDVTDPENLEKRYRRFLPGARNSTVTLGGWYDDDDSLGNDDAATDDAAKTDDSTKTDCGVCANYETLRPNVA